MICVDNRAPLAPRSFAGATLLALAAVALLVKGAGLPNHVTQFYLAAAVLAIAYQRIWILRPQQRHEWILPVLNVLLLSCLFRLVVGLGEIAPFGWLRIPQVVTQSEQKWMAVIPHVSLNWIPADVAAWRVDLTQLQTFLLLLSFVGGIFRFQPFASFTALALLVVSGPQLFRYRWELVFPALLMSLVCAYLQAPETKDVLTASPLPPTPV